MEAQKPWADKWVEVRSLNPGGQGETFVVRRSSPPSEQAVLKVLRSHIALDAKARRRMFQEVTNLRVLHNAGSKVPEVLDSNTESFEDSAVPLYFVMEYVEGVTLAETLHTHTALTVENSVGIALDLCQTLGIAGKEGISHRDIKPENIIVRSLTPPDVVMVDFGLSFNKDYTSKLTETEETLDNKFLSLPERRGPGENKRDPRSDLTGVCAVLFYCLTGCSPRNLRDSSGKPPHRWQNYSLAQRVKDEKQLSALNMLLDRGFNYEIDSRFQTIDELRARLTEVLSPAVQTPDEDFDFVLAREVAALRKNDRKTQLADYRNNANVLVQSFQQCISGIRKSFSNQRTFEIGQANMMHGVDERTEHGDLVATLIIDLFVHLHTRQYQVLYKITSVGTECVVHREIVERRGNIVSQVVAPQLVTRYQGDLVPEPAPIVADIKPALAKAMATLSTSIQGRL